MSMDRCHDCGRTVDTDDDPGCYVEVSKHKDVCVCEFCREAREIDAEIDAENASPRSLLSNAG